MIRLDYVAKVKVHLWLYSGVNGSSLCVDTRPNVTLLSLPVETDASYPSLNSGVHTLIAQSTLWDQTQEGNPHRS